MALTRRSVLGASAGWAAAAASFGRAHGAEASPADGATAAGAVEHEADGALETRVHGGLGRLRMKVFGFREASRPNLFVTYLIPPGCSEGVHVHRLGDRDLGAYEEFYYVVQGRGLMTIGERALPVAAGDHVHAPLGVPHGIANPARYGELKVFLTAIERS